MKISMVSVCLLLIAAPTPWVFGCECGCAPGVYEDENGVCKPTGMVALENLDRTVVDECEKWYYTLAKEQRNLVKNTLNKFLKDEEERGESWRLVDDLENLLDAETRGAASVRKCAAWFFNLSKEVQQNIVDKENRAVY